jgi:hypothetical protein
MTKDGYKNYMSLTQPKPYEIHKLLSVLLEDQDLEQAFLLTARYMEQMDDSFLRFNHLCLAVRLGHIQQALDFLQSLLTTNHWFSTWFLRRSDELKPLFVLPEFEKYLQLLTEKEADYWRQKVMQPILPPAGWPAWKWLQYPGRCPTMELCTAARLAGDIPSRQSSGGVRKTLVGCP